MAIHSFEVIGEHSAPEEFKDYLYESLKMRRHLHIRAIAILDELARKRGDVAEREFELIIREVHPDKDAFFVNVSDVETKDWIRIDVDDHVHFELIMP